MKALTLVLRSLVFYWRTNLGVLAGATISTAILVGALVVGDSVRNSLLQQTLQRLGDTELALASGDRYVTSALADRLSQDLDTMVVPVLALDGVALSEQGRRANRVQVLGVDERFFNLADAPDLVGDLSSEEVVVNRRLAAKLGLTSSDELLVRVATPRMIPGDVPLTSSSSTSVARRWRVAAVAGADQMGRFSLAANQVAPQTVLLPLSRLAELTGLVGRVNMLLIKRRPDRQLDPAQVQRQLARSWRLADAGLSLRRLDDGGGLELVSSRMFLEQPVVAAGTQAAPATVVFTYLVNLIGSEHGSTPYSFVAAPGPPLVDEDMSDDEIILNRWVAEDIGVSPGDQVNLAFFVPGKTNQLVEKRACFRLRSIVPIAGAAADRQLMPHIPGLSDAGSCRDWNPGFPIDLDRIRDRDEAYWDTYRGTPKAFVTLAAARHLWGNRFGSATALRYGADVKPDDLAAELVARLDPRALGLVFTPVRQQGIVAGTEAVDFGQLFVGLSFFIIVASLLLTGLLFALGVEQRTGALGLYKAQGFSGSLIRLLVLGEGLGIAVLGSIVGAALGIAYNELVLTFLGGLWQGAVGATVLHPKIEVSTVALGTASGVGLSLVVMILAVRSLLRRSAPELLGGAPGVGASTGRVRPRLSIVGGAGCVLVALVIVAMVDPGRGREVASAFGGAGVALLCGCVGILRGLLARLTARPSMVTLTPWQLGLRNMARKRRRSLTAVVLLASGVFIVVAVAANRRDTGANADQRESGTGGFALYCETTLPVLYDLQQPSTRRLLGFGEPGNGVEVVGVRKRPGDDASCLNLNRTSHPSLLGIAPDQLATRGSFTFVKLAEECDPTSPWWCLSAKLADGAIPAVADQEVISWGLGKAVGDTLTYTNERGQEMTVRLVGGLAASVFQGSLLIAEDALLANYPSVSGVQVLLVDAPARQAAPLAETLERTLQDYGGQVSTGAERLALFTQVENTYLTIFLALGGLGLVIGTLGMGVIVVRDVVAQRGELAVLRAIGFSRALLKRQLLAEYSVVVLAGVGCGAAAALVAVLPALMSPGAQVPVVGLLLTLAAIVVSSFVWVLVAVGVATGGDLYRALRNE